MTTIHLHNKSRPILNKGFIRLVDCMPRIISSEAWHLKCDSAIVQAARVSFGQGLKDQTTDTKNTFRNIAFTGTCFFIGCRN